ncbi:fumarylacetoacetate hydrolase family protein [Nocardia sp. NPDC058705]|uniref:fumarylacetoacetate hydrolase family protein n=1 Tax=Nocardia sp. NPDC058705 TaxID=3346609 RepID=UPI00369A8DFF
MRATLNFAPVLGDSRPSCLLPTGVVLPGSLIGIGHNYRDTEEREPRSNDRIPLIFGKFANSVIGNGAPIVVSDALSDDVVCEGELALVIGTTVRAVDSERVALHALAGVCLANDVSARDLQAADGQSTRGKSLDTFCPLGPELVALEEIPNLSALELTTRIDDEIVQRARVAQMWFSPAELIMFCSEFMTLYPGDVILTGTPAAPDDRLRIRPGQTVEVSAPGLGTLRNPVVAG